MAKPIRLTPKKDGKSWRLSVPPKLSPTGRRQNLFYRTQALALAAAADLKAKREEFGNQARAISPTIADQATAADALLRPWGITILQAAERIAAMEQATAASVTVETALAAYRAAKEDLSDKQQQSIRHMEAHMKEDFAGRNMNTITGEEVAEHLEKRTSGPAAFNAKIRLYTSLWRWAATKPRQWCQPDTLAHIERKKTKPGEIGILTAKEAALLLATAEKHYPETVIPFAVALFTGMRQAELARLQACDFVNGGINVPAENDRKNNRRRFMETPTPLAAWLKAYPVNDPVIPANWARKYDAVRRLAGWDLVADMLDEKKLEKPTLGPWPSNALRHTAATAALGNGKTMQNLIFEHGHTEGEDMLKRHYLGLMSKKDALAIWRIGPNGKKLPAMEAVA